MEYEDTRTISTPEGVQLELPLAGLGSRFAAGLLDGIVQGAIVLAAVLAAALAGSEVAGAVLIPLAFLVAVIGYDVLFEVRAGGRTPGKRAVGLRVVMADGRAIGLRASAVRNLLRLVEGVPLSYLPAIACILLTRDNQRLGDLAAGTVVTREPRGLAAPEPHAGGTPAEALADWDVSAVTAQELAAVRSFLARRGGFEAGARSALAAQLAGALADRVAGAPAGMAPERFLEDLARAKGIRG